METLTSIVAVGTHGEIGAGNRLPWRVRSDMRFFRKETVDQVVIMGRKTFDSLGGKGLPDRKNVVVTHGFGLSSMPTGCKVANSIIEALVLAQSWKAKRQSVYIVGGATMYEQFSPYVDRYLITQVDKAVADADTFFSDQILGDLADWRMTRLLSGAADGVHDEASYGIFEFKRLDNDHAHSRSAAIEAFVRRSRGNSLYGNDWKLQAAS